MNKTPRRLTFLCLSFLWCGPACQDAEDPASPDGQPDVVTQDLLTRCTKSSQCNDGNACTIDRCRWGYCRHYLVANGSACSDGNLCTTADACQSGACQGTSTVTCAALDSCHVAGTCDPTTGLCSTPPAADGTSCEDGSLCTVSDTCQSGSCQTGSQVSCSPADACHEAGVCDPATGTCQAGAAIACGAPAPRPLSPWSGQTLSIARPTFRWRLEWGSDGAAIDLCRDRACSQLEQTLTATGSSLALDVDLPVGTWYWRLHGRSGTATGLMTSPTWAFTVGTCVPGNVDKKTQVADVNGDGWTDQIVNAGRTWDYQSILHVYLGSASGTSVNPDKILYSKPSVDTDMSFQIPTPIGDWNGDGYSDLLVRRHGEDTPATLTRFRGDGIGLLYQDNEWSDSECRPGWFSPQVCDESWGYAHVGGDFNADGSAEYAYSDTYWYDSWATPGVVYLSTTNPSRLLRPLAAGEYASSDGFGSSIKVIDYNCDGYDDLMIYAAALSKNYIFLGSSTGPSSTPALTL